VEKLEATLKRTAENISTGSTKAQPPEGSKPSGGSPTVAGPGDPNCPHCHGVGYIREDVEVGHPNFGKLFPCSCRLSEIEAAQKQRQREISSLGPLANRIFDNFQPEGHASQPGRYPSLRLALTESHKYAEAPRGWLLLQGGYGCGKTHLAAAVANFAVEMGVPTLFLTVPDLLDMLRFSYDSEDTTFESRFNEIRTHAYFGNILETSFGKIGYLVENWQRTNDGFKTIDTNPPDVRNGDKTGFTKVEPMIKMMFEPNSRLYQRFEFRLGYTDLDADETYLGATTADFRADPFRRYAASRFDNIATEQFRTHLRHFLQLADETLLTTTVYGNTFNRNWAKLDSCGGAPSNMSQCIESNTNLLTGNAAGSWRLRNNDRRYYSQGVEAVLDHTFRTGEVKQNIVAGARYHYDQMRRFQHDETYTQAANGALTAVAIGAPGSQDSRREGTKAIALHIRDYITFGRLTVSPGLRYEHLRFTLDRLSPQTFPETSRDANMDMWSGGVGLNYEVKTDLSLFGGIWRGVSNPEPGAHITENLGEESTLSFEAGVRYKNPRLAFGTELAFFHTDFNNLLVRDNIGGGSPKSENVGKIRNQGIEYQVQYDPGTHLQLPFKNPWYFNITYSNARIRTATTSNDQESLFAGAIPGAKVPYVPKVQFNLGSGIVYDKWNLNVDAYYVDPTFTTADNSDMQVNPINSTPNARFGRTDAFFITDISGGYQYKKNVRLFTNFYNVTNAEYIVTRHPHGPRPGAPFMMFGGVEMTF